MPLESRWDWCKLIQSPDHVTSDHVKLAYQLNHSVCELKACDSTCKSSPFCLNNLSCLDSSQCSNSLKERTIEPTDITIQPIHNGLKNYGNTCYLNAFLQIYFRIDRLREAVYSLPTDVDANGVLYQLQLIFSQLQLSTSGVVDPGGLIEALRLCEEEQQDAPEFHCLFMHLLESRFMEAGLSVVNDLLRGEYVYETRCLNCGRSSKQPSDFLELSLKVSSSSLLGCLENYLKEEQLTGENQYACPQCACKQNGIRRGYITRSPSLLCIQLLRFRYDPRTGQRKKHKGSVRLPDRLQLTSLTNVNQSDCTVSCLAPQSNSNQIERRTYLLCGVLLHIGAHPTSGHYVAVVRDGRNGDSSSQNSECADCWTVCNDLEVCTVPAAQFSLNKVNGTSKTFYTPATSTMDISTFASEQVADKRPHVVGNTKDDDNKKPRLEDGTEDSSLSGDATAVVPRWHSSCSAYMVFYRAMDDYQSNMVVPVPDALRNMVEEANQCRQQELVDDKMHQNNKMSMLHECLANLRPDVSEGNYTDSILKSVSLVPTQWLRDWLDQPEYPPPCLTERLPTSSPLEKQVMMEPQSHRKAIMYSFPPCPHGRIPVDMDTSLYRAVSTNGLLRSIGQSEDDSSTINISRFEPCFDCVRLKVALIHLERSIQALSKLIDRFLRSGEALSTPEQLCESLDPAEQIECPRYYWISKRSLRYWRPLARTYITQLYSATVGQPARDKIPNPINSELLCPHGHLRANRGQLRCLPASLWYGLVGLFPQANIPTAPFCPGDALSASCRKCELLELSLVKQAEFERTSLPHLTANMGRKLWNPLTNGQLSDIGERQRFPPKRSDRVVSTNCEATSSGKHCFALDSSQSEPDAAVATSQMVYLVPFQFIKKWRRFLRNPSLANVPKRFESGLNADGVLCKHCKLTMPWEELITNSYLFPLDRMEWEILSHNYTPQELDFGEDDDEYEEEVEPAHDDPQISFEQRPVLPTVFLTPSTSHPNEWDFHPANYAMCCADCYKELVKQRRLFRNAKIRVRLVASLDEALSATFMTDNTNELSSADQRNELRTSNSLPIFTCPTQDSRPEGHPTSFHTTSPNIGSVRRSTRQRMQVNDYVILADSSLSVREMKVQLMQLTGVFPVDQHLLYHGIELTDVDQTLQELNICADSLLFLWTDSPVLNDTVYCPSDRSVFPKSMSNNQTSLTSSPKASRSNDVAPVEVGFKGTRLLGTGL